MLGAYIFIIVISSFGIDPLIIMYYPSMSLVTVFILKSMLSEISIATNLISFDFHLHGICFSIPSLSVCMCP